MKIPTFEPFTRLPVRDDHRHGKGQVMERVSVIVFFCVALIVGIILQAPPQVYKNVSSYYERLSKRQTSGQVTNEARPPIRKAHARKPAAGQVEEMSTASFASFDDEDATSLQKDKSLDGDSTSKKTKARR